MVWAIYVHDIPYAMLSPLAACYVGARVDVCPNPELGAIWSSELNPEWAMYSVYKMQRAHGGQIENKRLTEVKAGFPETALKTKKYDAKKKESNHLET